MHVKADVKSRFSKFLKTTQIRLIFHMAIAFVFLVPIRYGSSTNSLALGSYLQKLFTKIPDHGDQENGKMR